MPSPKPQRDQDVTAEFLQRTRAMSVGATVLLSMWLFGNLYESVVWNPQLLADPRPGTVVGEFAIGSPVYYYLPWSPIGIVLAVALRVRFGSIAPRHVRRAWTTALGLFGVALAAKAFLITRVNPVFRDAGASSGTVHDHALVWAFVNATAVVAVAAGLVLFTMWRRPRAGGYGGSGPT